MDLQDFGADQPNALLSGFETPCPIDFENWFARLWGCTTECIIRWIWNTLPYWFLGCKIAVAWLSCKIARTLGCTTECIIRWICKTLGRHSTNALLSWFETPCPIDFKIDLQDFGRLLNALLGGFETPCPIDFWVARLLLPDWVARLPEPWAVPTECIIRWICKTLGRTTECIIKLIWNTLSYWFWKLIWNTLSYWFLGCKIAVAWLSCKIARTLGRALLNALLGGFARLWGGPLNALLGGFETPCPIDFENWFARLWRTTECIIRWICNTLPYWFWKLICKTLGRTTECIIRWICNTLPYWFWKIVIWIKIVISLACINWFGDVFIIKSPVIIIKDVNNIKRYFILLLLNKTSLFVLENLIFKFVDYYPIIKINKYFSYFSIFLSFP